MTEGQLEDNCIPDKSEIKAAWKVSKIKYAYNPQRHGQTTGKKVTRNCFTNYSECKKLDTLKKISETLKWILKKMAEPGPPTHNTFKRRTSSLENNIKESPKIQLRETSTLRVSKIHLQ